MKKTLSIIAALVLALGMTQCKKAEKPQASTGNPIHVTFTATYGGERTTFTPADGSFTWSSGVTEYIYVGGSAHEGCIGTLSAEGNGQSTLTFTGDITPTDGETLHFFYLGKGKDGSAVTSLDFSNQDGTLENLTNFHVAVGSQAYTIGMTDFSASLNPLVAFAYFDLNGFGTNTAVSISGDGVYSTATIDYQNGTIAGNTKGSISVGTPLSGGNYVALIPSTSVSSTDYATTVGFGSTGYTGSLKFERGIFAGRYYTTADGDALEVEATFVGPAVFYVASNSTVQFSSGNLYYDGNNWGFESTPKYGEVVINGYVNLFNYAATGTGSGIDIYDKVTNKFIDLSVNDGSDWGYCANQAKLGGYENWHTPTFEEWRYLFNTRPNALSLLGVGQVEGIHGLILLPDNWAPSASEGFTTGFSGSWESNSYTTEQWNIMSNKGAVFLPAAGERGLNNTFYSNNGNLGEYWSSKMNRRMYFGREGVYGLGNYDFSNGYFGLSVRLVRYVSIVN